MFVKENPDRKKNADNLDNFELLYRSIYNLDSISNKKLDFVKTKIKDAALTLFCNFNANLSHSLSDDTYWDFSKNTNLVIQKSYKGNRVVTIDKDICVKHIELIFKGKVDTKKGLLNF